MRFVNSTVPAHYTFDFITDLFNEEHYLNYKYQDYCSFYIVCDLKEEVLGKISFAFENGKAISLPQLPYGGFSLSTKVSFELLSQFVSYLEKELTSRALVEVIIRMPAKGLSGFLPSLIGKVFDTHGFAMHSECNHHLRVSNESLLSRFHSMEQRKLKKAMRLALIFEKTSNEDFEKVYAFIEACRQERGWEISMSYNDLLRATAEFPDRYQLFVVKNDGRLVAATIAVKINSQILYNFYPANKIEDKGISPMVFLIHELYEYSRRNDFIFLDLGTSSVSDQPIESLITFKERIGGVISEKCTYIKNFSS